jgi:transcriptional regulator GlxA family with amidase domain
MTLFDASPDPLSVTVLVLPECSMMTVASVIEPMRACNRISRGERIAWRVVTLDGGPVPLSCGLPLASQGRLEAASGGDLLVVVAGFDALRHAGRPVTGRLRRLLPRFGAVAGIEAGSWVLGAAGMLRGRRATTHWEDLEDFAARFLDTEVRADRYVIDGSVLTAGGASPAFDLMLHLIRGRFGYAVALDVASVFIYDEAHAASDAQPFVSLGRLGDREPRVARAIRVMEQALDRPLSTAAVARRVGVSVRLLEGLFRRTLDTSPGAYYAALRMQAARRLVADTALPLHEVALRTGFASPSSFSHSFRRHTGLPARDFRARARAARPGFVA